MLRFTVEIDWVLLSLVGILGMVLTALYAAVLSTQGGRRLCARRTEWSVVGGHLLMALTMCFISPPMAALWLVWSVLHGFPLMARGELLRWARENQREAGMMAALRGVLRGRMVGVYEASDDSSAGNGHGHNGAGVGRSE